jgi:predicted CoA-substrate-specific enzyme activase
MNTSDIYVGVDVGASRTKVAILDNQKNVIGRAVRKSGTDFTKSSESCLKSALKKAGVERSCVVSTISTGYGRKNVDFSVDTKTEISCHGKGCYFYFPQAITIIDIGGQDNKIINLDAQGRRTGFKMNRKCAAGTGAFLEEMSVRLEIPLEQMNKLAKQSQDIVELGSFCTVFSATEVLEKIRQGKKVPDIVKGLFSSVINRVLEMASFTDSLVMSGGVVAYNPYLVKMIEERIDRTILVPEHPQYSGAIGAALYAMEAAET